MKMMIEKGEISCALHMERGVLSQVGEEIRKAVSGNKIAVIMEEKAGLLYGDRMREILEKEGFSIRFIIPSAEEGLDRLREICDEFSDFSLSADDGILVISGNDILGPAGFAAATWRGGIPLFYLPSNLSAQLGCPVDGKVYLPVSTGERISITAPLRGIFIDPDILARQPVRHIHEGLAEAVRIGVAGDYELFEILESVKEEEDIRLHMDEILLHVLLLKKGAAEEGGEALLRLSFGSALQKAVEDYFEGSTFTEGEALSLGMYLLTKNTENMGITEKGTADRLFQVLHRLALPTSITIPAEDLISSIRKEERGGKIYLPVLKKIGKADVLSMKPSELADCIERGNYE